jgi:ribokinase
MTHGRGVAVVGSANLDVVVSLARFPGPGETVLGDDLEEVAGGKGLNQAIAAARHSPTTFIGCVGSDEAGEQLLGRLNRAGVDTAHTWRADGPTGRAFIQVTPDGENSIVVTALANRRLEAATVVRALEAVAPAVVLAQLEIPFETVEAAAGWAAGSGARFVLNPSPVQPLPASLLALCDPVVVNMSEAAAIVGAPPAADDGDASAEGLARTLLDRTRSVALTHGGRGVFVAEEGGGVSHVPGHRVPVVDTTGAGDEFAGALAAALGAGLSLESAATVANDAAARLVQIPRRER